jgi:hypothetical protein
MKFDINNIENYTGQDLILLVGAPGSRWSSIYLNLIQNTEINSSDSNAARQWTMPLTFHDGRIFNIGNHRGAYWGPGNQFGERFDVLNSLSKDQILSEFMLPFNDWTGIKVIKSHWFSYHLDYLTGLFPDAKLISCYAEDVDCFYWWHKCGGWGISYPNYSWYNNDEKMLAKIKEENYNLLKFNKRRKADFVKTDTITLFKLLNLSTENLVSVSLKTEVAIVSTNAVSNFDHILL